MSTTFSWAPVVPPPPPGGSIDTDLAHMIARRGAGYWLRPNEPVNWSEVGGLTLGADDVGWLEGVRDASAEDLEVRDSADELLAAIAKHGSVRVVVER